MISLGRIGTLFCATWLITVPTLFAQGKGGKCRDLPIRVTLLPSNVGTSVLQGDGSDTYEDGKNGVFAVIRFCSGTGDATVSTSTRRVRISFPEPVEDSALSGQTPSWVATEISVSFFFNVRNILCQTGSCGDTFTTRMAWQFTGPDGKYYHLRFHPAVADAPDLHSPNLLVNEPDINLPFETSPVVVRHQRGTCNDAGGDPADFDQWEVTAASTNSDPGILQLGTLHRFPSKPKDQKLHMGQYSMPYRLRIEALRCD